MTRLLRSQIAELEATNQRLAAGEARFRRVFEANPLPMWIADHATGGFIAVNEAALALYGYTPRRVSGLKSAALEVEPTPKTALRRSRISARTAAQLQVVAALARDRIRRPQRRSRLGFDLTERIAAERKLHEEAGKLRRSVAPHVVDAAADGCWVLDGDGRLLDVNAAYCRMSGYSREELLKMNASQIEDQSTGETTMRLQLGRVRAAVATKPSIAASDGTLLDVEVSVGMLENARGDSIVLIRDVSQRRRETVVAARRRSDSSNSSSICSSRPRAFDESAIVRRVIEQAADIDAAARSHICTSSIRRTRP